MALIVEDGTCPDMANTYNDRATADAYLAPRGLWPAPPDPVADPENPDANPTQPEDPNGTAKDAALIRAFDYLNGPLEWLGQKVDWQREPAWPRVYVPMPGSDPHALEYIPENIVPDAVKRAQLELAALIYGGDDPLAPVERGGAVVAETESASKGVDVLKKSTSHSVTYADNAPVESWLPSVYPLLRPFLAEVPGESAGGFSVVEIVRG